MILPRASAGQEAGFDQGLIWLAGNTTVAKRPSGRWSDGTPIGRHKELSLAARTHGTREIGDSREDQRLLAIYCYGMEAIMQDKISPIQLFLAAMTLSSVGGLAALLRSNNTLSARAIASAVLSSGVMGLVIALTSYTYFGVTNPFFLLGVCGLAGIGGTTVVDFLVLVMKNGGLDVNISPKRLPHDNEED